MTLTPRHIKESKVAALNLHISDINDFRSKYGAQKKVVDGIKFDSIKEAKRYGELKLLLRSGEIDLLKLQVPFELNPGGTYSLKYFADFVYWDCMKKETVVEDVKGFRNKTYLKKRKLMKKVHGIVIKET